MCCGELVIVANWRPPIAPMTTPAYMRMTEATPETAKRRSWKRSVTVHSFARLLTIPTLRSGADFLVGRPGDLRVGRPDEIPAAADRPTG
jgi:hypothetical protein